MDMLGLIATTALALGAWLAIAQTRGRAYCRDVSAESRTERCPKGR